MLEKDKIQEAYEQIITEGNYFVTKKVKQNRVRKVMEKAQDAFWKVVAKEFKEVQYGDMDPGQVMKMEDGMMDAINVWLENNYEM